MLSARNLLNAVALTTLAGSLAGCTLVVPVGVDPIRPEWNGLPAETSTTSPRLGDCIDVTVPAAEECDGLDNDCNGLADDGGVCDRTTTFYQSADLDILIVMDPRTEAEEARIKLLEALPSLLTPLSATQRRVHVGVASMDAQSESGRGRLAMTGGQTFAQVGFDGDPSPALDFLGQVFTELEAPPGRIGSRFVTQEALLANRPFNAGFARDGGYMALLYLSTTEDREEPSVNQLYERMDALWLPDRWSASAIVQVRPENCVGVPSVEHIGETYRRLWDLTDGGILADHCLPSYDGVMRELADTLKVVSLIDTFTFFDEPDPTSVQVEIDVGDGFRDLDPDRYHVTDRELRLDRPPPPDSEIRVSYTALP